MSSRVLVTGCSSGIGRACAVELASRGYRVVATARRVEALLGLDGVEHVQLDVTDAASVATAVERAGPVDVLVNNAGISAWGPVEVLGPSVLDDVLATNVVGVARVTAAFLPGMRERRRGRIVNVSTAALRGFPLLGAYAASKAALEAWTEALRFEVAAFGITVALVEPAGVESAFAANRLAAEVRDDDYGSLHQRALAALTGMRAGAMRAEDVAVAIADVVAAADPPLRNPIGADATRLLGERRAVDDDAYEAAVRASTSLADELVDAGRLQAHLRDAAPQLGAIGVVRRITSGSSNEVFEVDCAGAGTVILRRPPRVKLSPSAHDVVREHRVLTALAGSAVPHPSPIHLCTDESVIGAPFYLMERIDGFHLKAPYPELVERDRARVLPALANAFVDALADLALVDWQRAGLEGFGRPAGYLERQVDRWFGQLEHYRTRVIPEIDWTAEWLRENRPAAQPPAIIHGDYQFLNVLFALDSPPRVAAVLDWEQSTLGDPLVDLGWMLGLWAEGGEDSPLNDFYGNATQEPEMPTRRELAVRYADRTGRDVSAIAWYEVLGLFKLACITEGSYARHVRGTSDSPLHADFGWIVPKLVATAAAIARGERD